MSNYSNTKATIAANVYTNHNNEVTAEMVKTGINAVVDTLIAGGFLYKGVATTSTNPGSPDANVFYIATAPGTYTNFGSLVVADGEVAILKYNGSWSKEVTGAATAAQVSALGHEVGNLIFEVDGGLAPEVDVTPTTTLGYYFYKSSGVLKADTNGGSYHNGVVVDATTFSDGIDVSSYIGRTIKVKISNYGASSQRLTAIIDENHNVLAEVQERNYVADGANRSAELVVPSGAKYLYWSAVGTLESIVIEEGTTIQPGLMDKYEDLAKEVDEMEAVLTEVSASTGFPVNLSDCNLYMGINPSGQFREGYEMSTHPIRVKPGQTINFTTNQVDVNGTLVTITERVAFYANEHISSFVSVVQNSYASLSSFVVPDGANYMRISIGIGNNATHRYYTDGDLTISYASTDFLFDLPFMKDDIELSKYGRWREIRRVDTYAGSWQVSSGKLVHGWTAAGVCSNSPIVVQPGDYVSMKRPNTNLIYLYGGVFVDADYSIVKNVTTDNYDELLVPAGARYLWLNLRAFQTELMDVFDDNISFMFNVSPRSYYDNDWNIIRQNDKIETFAKLANVKQPAKVGGTPQTAPLSILFFSDIHGDADNLARIVEFYNYWNGTGRYSTYIDAMLSGGDNVQTYQAANAFDYWSGVPGAGNILQTIGNHDAAANAALTETADQKDVYDIEFAPFVADWGVTQPTGAAANGLMYYYKDFSTPKIRLIVLDCMYWNAAQLSWFESALSSARTGGYAVVACSHFPVGNTSVIDCNFLSKDFSASGGSRLTNPISAVDSFISAGGEFICWLSGHTHADGFGTIDEHPGQINLIIDTARSGSSAAQDAAALVGTRTQDCFNIIGFDTYSKLIKVVRIGRDYDRHLRHIGEMCVDYSTKQVQYTR